MEPITEKHQVATYFEKARCPENGCKGFLKSTGESFSNFYETTFLHSCDTCCIHVEFNKRYPRIIHQEINNNV